MKGENEIDLVELLRSILKRWKLIFCITLVCTIASVVLTFFVIKPKYQVRTKLFIGKETTDTKDQNYNTNDVTMYQRLLKTYAQMIRTNDLVSKAIIDKNLNINSQQVLKKLTVIPSEETQVIQISYIDTDKYMEKNLVDSITSEFIKESHELIPNGKVEVIEATKLPEKPISPRKTKNIAVGLSFGLILGILIAIILDFTDSTFENKDQLENIVGLPVIGTIPDENKVNRRYR